MNISGVGSFAGGLADAFQGGLNAKAQRENIAARTTAQRLVNEAKQRDVDNSPKISAELKRDDAANTDAARSAASLDATGLSTGPASGPGGGYAPSAPDPAMAYRQQLAETFRQNGLHGLARGVGSVETGAGVDQASDSAGAQPRGAATGTAVPATVIPKMTTALAGPAAGLTYGVTPQTFGAA